MNPITALVWTPDTDFVQVSYTYGDALASFNEARNS